MAHKYTKDISDSQTERQLLYNNHMIIIHYLSLAPWGLFLVDTFIKMCETLGGSKK